jgi:hypothetical protein
MDRDLEELAWPGRNPKPVIPFPGMPKKPVSVEVVQEGEERFLVKTYANGETVRESIVPRGNGTQTAPIGIGISIRPERGVHEACSETACPINRANSSHKKVRSTLLMI